MMAHPAVAEAAVIAVADAKWMERPLAVVALREGQKATEEELLAFLRERFPKWWLPDGVAFLPQLPKNATGKFQKSALREQFKDFKTRSPIANQGA